MFFGKESDNLKVNPVIPPEEIVKNSTFLDNLFEFSFWTFDIFKKYTAVYVQYIYAGFAVLSIMTEGGIGVFSSETDHTGEIL